MPHALDQYSGLYAPVAPFATGRLNRGKHSLYYEQSGNPDGVAVMFLHGGPGAGCAPVHRQLFDPVKCHAIFLDQRGAGRSEPYADITENTTQDLVEDIEALRQHLKLDKMLIFGGSWGSTLGLCYGVAHPEHCLGFVLRGIFLGSRAEIDWFLYDMGRFYPEAYARFIDHLSPSEHHDILNAYYRQLTSPSHTIAMAAAQAWSAYENSCATLAAARRTAGSAALSLALIEAHYFMSDCFLPPDYLLSHIDSISHLPCQIIQGRHDVICPPHSAFELAGLWGDNAQLHMIDDAGHSAFEAGISSQLIRSVNMMLKQLPV